MIRQRWALVVGASGLSVGALRLALPPANVSPLAFVAWVPVLLAIRRTSWVGVLSTGFLHGALMALATQSWVVGALQRNAEASLPGAMWALALLAGLQALQTSAWLVLLRAGERLGLPCWLSFGLAAPVVHEALPVVFPWTMALMVHDRPVWLQGAALGGAALVDLWICLVNALIAHALTHFVVEWGTRERALRTRADLGARFSAGLLRSRGLRYLASAGLVLLVARVGGTLAMTRQERLELEAAVGRVALGHVRSDPSGRPRDVIPELRRTSLEITRRQPAVDFVLWPESSLARPVAQNQLEALTRDYLLRDRAGGSRGDHIEPPLVIGVLLATEDSTTNSAVALGWPGVLLGRYDKRKLLTLGESAMSPWGMPVPPGLPKPVGVFAPGQSEAALTLNERRVSIRICYEALFADAYRQDVPESTPSVLANASSDAWFAGTTAPELHFALARLRAVEERRYLLRSTRDGVTAVVDSVGRVRHERRGAGTGTELVEFRWLSEPSFYAAHGKGWLVYSGLTALIAAALARTARAARRRSHA